MVVTRLHAKLFEAAALELDRRTRFHFVGQNVRPGYLKSIERQLQGVTRPDVEGELHFMVGVVESGPVIEGRFLALKTLFKRILRPHSAHTAYVHRMIIQRIAEQHEGLTKLVESVADENEKLREDLASLAETLRAEIGERLADAGAGNSDSLSGAGLEIVPAGCKVLVGTVPVRKRGYIHFDPTDAACPPLDRLPVNPGSLTEVVAANVLESYTVDDVRDVLLPYWASLLRPGGKLGVVADDLGAAGDRFRDGQIDFSELAGVLFGDGGRPRRRRPTRRSRSGGTSRRRGWSTCA